MTISIIWAIFTVLFLFMAIWEWRNSKKELESLKQADFAHGKVVIQGLNLEDFAKELNRANQTSHRIAATAYFLAGLTALGSLIIPLIQTR